MTNLGILEHQDFAEISPPVEYKLTVIGQRVRKILKAVDLLQHDIKT